jgi:hypothetical protein
MTCWKQKIDQGEEEKKEDIYNGIGGRESCNLFL